MHVKIHTFLQPILRRICPSELHNLYGPKPSHSKKKATIARTTGCHIGEKTALNAR
uniref:Uncharacterized protein n=1 Tax=Anguilla anguilla TaxID=7936 RepID=A0A0E9V9B2_ANGAN